MTGRDRRAGSSRMGVGLEVGRAAYGLVELLVPARVGAVALGRPPGTGARRVARVLGVRHLVQGAAVLRGGDARAHRLGGAVDALHGLSMLGWLPFAGRDRRFYLFSGLLAASLAWAEWSAAGPVTDQLRQAKRVKSHRARVLR